MFRQSKPSEITLLEKEQLIATMTRLVEILHENRHSAQADAVIKPLEYLIANDADNFVKSFLAVDIWGGSGSVWEVGGFSSRQVEIEFQTKIIQLVELMKECGIKSKKAESVAGFFKKEISKA
jgi:hypothetical protein